MPKYMIDIIKLPYKKESLEPHLDQNTIFNWYEKVTVEYLEKLKNCIKSHQQTFSKIIKNEPGDLNRLVVDYCQIRDVCQETNKDLCSDKKIQGLVRQYAGGLMNQNFFFENLAFNKNFSTKSEIGKLIINKFKNYENFCEQLIEQGLSIFGSGWVWLVIDHNQNLRIYKTFNQDNPWFLKMTPLFGISVWEHAYYLQYTNDRSKYLNSILNVINWEKVEQYYQEYLQEQNVLFNN